MTLPVLALTHALLVAVHGGVGGYYAREVGGADLYLGADPGAVLDALCRLAEGVGVAGVA